MVAVSTRCLYPSRVLSEGRHRAPTQRFPPALIVVSAIVVIAALGVGGFLLLGSANGQGLLGGIIGDDAPDMTVPEFAFDLRRTTAEPTEGDRRAKPSPQAKAAAKDVGAALSSLYTEAFLDPANWREGAYDDLWAMFAGEARRAAQGDVEVLTVGATLGETFDDIEPKIGSLSAEVLTDPEGEAALVVAKVAFKALGAGTDGTTTVFASEGLFFLEPAGGGWTVVSYDVRRRDEMKQPKPGPTGSPSAEASG